MDSRKMTSSASLGKTLTRNKQPLSYHTSFLDEHSPHQFEDAMLHNLSYQEIKAATYAKGKQRTKAISHLDGSHIHKQYMQTEDNHHEFNQFKQLQLQKNSHHRSQNIHQPQSTPKLVGKMNDSRSDVLRQIDGNGVTVQTSNYAKKANFVKKSACKQFQQAQAQAHHTSHHHSKFKFDQPELDPTITEAVLYKSMVLSRSYQQLHNFITSLGEIKWILTQSNSLLTALAEDLGAQHDEQHSVLDNLRKESQALLNRWNKIEGMQSIQAIGQQIQQYNNGKLIRDYVEQLRVNPQGNRLELSRKYISSVNKQISKQLSKNNEIYEQPQPQHQFHNISTQFQNINLRTEGRNEQDASLRQLIDLQTSQLNQLANERDNLQSNVEEWKQKYYKMKERGQVIQSKWIKSKIYATRVIDGVKQIIKKLSQSCCITARQFNTAQTAQTQYNTARQEYDGLQLNRIIKLIESWQQFSNGVTPINASKSNASNAPPQGNQQLQQIISLQYDINSLLSTRQLLKNREEANTVIKIQEKERLQSMTRMLLGQAQCIEEMLKSK